jgi:AraC family transcriptional regulator
MNSNNEYISRINKVLDYIDNNISDNFTLSDLSKVACFSKFHFHRIFYSIIGETLFHYIQRIRIKKSENMLKNYPDKTITEIAFKCGFTSSAIFSRNFKNYFNMTPTKWKKNNISIAGYNNSNLSQKISNLKKDIIDYSRYIEFNSNTIIWRINMKDENYSVEVKDFPETSVAYVRHIGPYKEDLKVFEKLYAKLLSWAGPRNLVNDESLFLNVYHDDPEITENKKLRLSVCINIPEKTEVSGEIGKMTIPAGKYAIARFTLGEKDYQEAWDWIYSKWLPQSGYEPDDRLPFELMKGTDSSGEKHIVDICVPVKAI